MNVTTSGDLGDIVCLMAILHKLGGKHRVLLTDDGRTKGILSREHIIRPLVESQDYIEECRPLKGDDKVDWHSEHFRIKHYNAVTQLVMQHANHGISVKAIPDQSYAKEPWIHIKPMDSIPGSIVIARSERYNNFMFPWEKIVDHYGDRLIFIGTVREHSTFCEKFGKVQYYPTGDLFYAARLIAASELFIGNQSSPMTLAEGMKHPSIQETSLTNPDCIYLRNNCQHVFDGYCTLPDIGGSGELQIESRINSTFTPKTGITPPGSWQYRGITHSSFNVLVSMLERCLHEGKAREEIERLVLEENYKRLPEYFMDKSLAGSIKTFQEAMINSKIELDKK